MINYKVGYRAPQQLPRSFIGAKVHSGKYAAQACFLGRCGEMVEGALGSKLDVQHVPAKAGEMPAVVVDNSAARRWGWVPSVTLERGIAEVAKEWGTANGASD